MRCLRMLQFNDDGDDNDDGGDDDFYERPL